MKPDEIVPGARLVRCLYPEREDLENYGPHIKQERFTVAHVDAFEVMLVPDAPNRRTFPKQQGEVCHHFHLIGSPEHAQHLHDIYTQTVRNMAAQVAEAQNRHAEWLAYTPEMELT